MSSSVIHHFREGDPEPSINPEKFTLFDLHFCPFCQRVRYTLDYHEIPYDRILVNPISKPSWYLRRNSSGKVPLLLYQGEKLTESDFIMQFVDQFKGAEASLLSVCGEKSFKEALELSSSIAVPRYKLCYSPEATKADADAFKAALSTLDETIKGPYLMGEKLSLADMALFPFLNAWDFVMNRVLKMDNASGDSVEALASQWPNVLKYRQLMNQKPYIMKTSFQDDVYAKFVDAYVHKKPNADF
ncbi:hypothetical protein AAHC03_05032 [Spirometra sp. Aus1]